MNQIDPCMVLGSEMQQEGLRVGAIISHSKALQDDLQKLGLKIKHHEDNIKSLKTQKNSVDGYIRDTRVALGRYQSSIAAEYKNRSLSCIQTEQQTVEQILQQDQTAAGLFFQLKLRHEAQASNLPFTKDVLGVVALLGKVNDDNLSRLLSEYLGLETMLAIVCKTYEGVKSLEIYGKEGMIDKTAGLHGFGPTIGRHLNGRFTVICLEQLRPYVGGFLDGDSQRKLDILKPKLPGGEYPPGFLGYAVNMVYVDNVNLSFLTASGHGLRETLFYNLFSRLQVYRTKAEMQLALPFISDGAISLDGGIMKGTGVFLLGDRKDVEVRFPICSEASNIPIDLNTEEQLKKMEWRQERLVEDIHREEELLNNAKLMFNSKKQEFMKFLGEGSRQVTQALEPSPTQVKPTHFEMNWR
ncbi:hypothetical protein QJS04_geneDACA019614 [Acorus gramineus]|uniref:Protein DEFECTIVE IN MERISTEM SILENCING 3-like n=1 Tax=Acorus gramineus TaxID=55184 RepID=A0AAV9BM39_ACOGR|nr:hypothetical protein QJS04_geneDACA019614 [Acorus gramineus]